MDRILGERGLPNNRDDDGDDHNDDVNDDEELGKPLDTSDLPRPYGTRAPSALEGSAMQEVDQVHDLSTGGPLRSNSLPPIAFAPPPSSMPSSRTNSTKTSSSSNLRSGTSPGSAISSQSTLLRGSFLDTLNRQRLTTIDSGRVLLPSSDNGDSQDVTTARGDPADPMTATTTTTTTLTATVSEPSLATDSVRQAPFATGSAATAAPQPALVTSASSGRSARRLSLIRKRNRFASPTKSLTRSDVDYVEETSEPVKSAIVRRYSPGESVLINNHSLGWIRLVNQHGYPSGSGATIEERKGPYCFVLATVKQVHFDESQPYYTVVIAHSGVDERADAQYMHPILSLEGEEAAMQAATSSIDHAERHDEGRGDVGLTDGGQVANFCDDALYCCVSILFPFFWLYEACAHGWGKHVMPLGRSVVKVMRFQGSLLLDGKNPYRCPMRFTVVNFVVICSVWYVFMDLIRLSFLPARVDDAIAKTNLFVWLVLVLELVFQVFIRPDGFKHLILTDKAYNPTTIRYIHWFHLTVETLSLLVYVPEFACVFSAKLDCGAAMPFSFHRAALLVTAGPTRWDTFYGHAYIALVGLRIFGLVRHWRNMWITNTFIKMKWAGKHTKGLRALIPLKATRESEEKRRLLSARNETPEQMEQRRRDDVLINASTIGTALMATNSYRALGLFWCIFGLFPVIFCISSTVVNSLGVEMTELLENTNVLANDNASDTCQFLSGSVWAWVTSVAPPIGSRRGDSDGDLDPHLMSVEILPQRCPFQNNGTFGQYCQTIQSSDARSDSGWTTDRAEFFSKLCKAWNQTWNVAPTPENLAMATGKRQGSIMLYSFNDTSTLTRYFSDGTASVNDELFSVIASFDATRSVELAATACLLSQMCLLFGILGGLSVLRRDAEVLVLNPLRRMLKKVAQYAQNPLVQARMHGGRSSGRGGKSHSRSRSNESFSSSSSDSNSDDEHELGSFETEQLITAVSKITDLLRKCWGVAGADIISTNLAAREGALEVFNPTVPGKSVYALFGFAYINDFDHILLSLKDDVMILINDVAAVLHGEVFRWGFGDSGQCNKNLGAAFLMVFRIGLIKEVMEKLEQATDVIFSTSKGTTTQGTAIRTPNRQSSQSNSRVFDSNRSVGSGSRDELSSGSSHMRVTKRTRALKKKNKDIDPKTLSLQSLPGISTFTDQAVIGMLKAFAGIHRDNKIRNWNNDFRLSAGVGVFEVSMIYGMDAGWAVEGAVGSEYKIDATYLSPHVNMASRMMMASKQYGVKIMLSQSVQELMSDVANTKLRHLDTVTVKGSSVKQRIYTYDARAQGVDFFLFSRTDEQADYDAEKYTPRIWETDQDLLSMRQHVSEEFLSVYNKGHRAYIQGDWEKALPLLEEANEIMLQTAMEEGYLEDQFEALAMQSGDDAKAAEEELKRMNGDGPSLYLIAFMKSLGGKAPDDWEGWHPLTRK